MENAEAAMIRTQMCEYIEHSVNQWAKAPHLSAKAKCNGVACSVLLMLDGGMSLYPFALTSTAEDGTEIVVNEDCNLHDAYVAYMQGKGG